MIGIVGSIPIPATFTNEDVDKPFWLWWVQTWSRQLDNKVLLPFHHSLVMYSTAMLVQTKGIRI